MMNAIAMVLAVCMMLLSVGGVDAQIPLGFAHFQTVKAASRPGATEHMLPAVIVRVTPQEGAGESFLSSNEVGVGLMPLRPGNYCFEAYDQKGRPLRLDPKQETCFSISKGETTEVGVGVLSE
jgi:hypothetical protein